MHVCVSMQVHLPLHVCGAQRSASGVFLYHSLPYLFAFLFIYLFIGAGQEFQVGQHWNVYYSLHRGLGGSELRSLYIFFEYPECSLPCLCLLP